MLCKVKAPWFVACNFFKVVDSFISKCDKNCHTLVSLGLIRNSEWILSPHVCCLIDRIAIAVISADGVIDGATFVHGVIATDRGVSITAIVPFSLKKASVRGSRGFTSRFGHFGCHALLGEPVDTPGHDSALRIWWSAIYGTAKRKKNDEFKHLFLVNPTKPSSL